MPADLPQSVYFVEKWAELRCKLRYFFKAQIVPVNVDMLNNEYGKSKIRDRQRVHVSPIRPIVNDRQFNITVPFQKKVGLMSSKTANMQVTMSKNFFLAGETAYLMVNIDNSQCSDPCSLEISQISKVKVYQSWRKYTVKRSHRKESFFLAAPGEQKSMILQFNIASKRPSPVKPGFFKHPDAYHYVNSLVPESIYAQTFSVTNFLELYLTHANTVFSNDSKKKFHFQLIQPSLVAGKVETPPPIFLDTNGQMMTMENPVISAPEGEIISGVAMDIPEDKSAKGKDQKEEEEDDPKAAAK